MNYFLDDKLGQNEDVIVNTHCVVDPDGREMYVDVYSYLDYLLDIAKIDPTPVIKPKKKQNIFKRHARKFLCTMAVIFGIFLSSKLTPDMSRVNTGDKPITNQNIDLDNSINSEKEVMGPNISDIKVKKNLSTSKKSKLRVGNTSRLKGSKLKRINIGSKLNLKNVNLKYTSLGGTPVTNTNNLSCDSYKINKFAVVKDNKIKEVVDVNSNNKRQSIHSIKKKYKSKYGSNTSVRANVDGYKNGEIYFNNIGWTSFSNIIQHNKVKVKQR